VRVVGGVGVVGVGGAGGLRVGRGGGGEEHAGHVARRRGVLRSGTERGEGRKGQGEGREVSVCMWHGSTAIVEGGWIGSHLVLLLLLLWSCLV
jgi:hypothetical protein